MDIGAAIKFNSWPGDSSGWTDGVAQASIPVTNLSPHVDGGPHSAAVTDLPDASSTLKFAAVIALSALVLLWFSGTLMFSGARL